MSPGTTTVRFLHTHTKRRPGKGNNQLIIQQQHTSRGASSRDDPPPGVSDGTGALLHENQHSSGSPDVSAVNVLTGTLSPLLEVTMSRHASEGYSLSIQRVFWAS